MRSMLFVSLLLSSTACDGSPKDRNPAGEPDCADGYLADEGSCVPEACGTGTWGALPVDDSTVYADASAGDGGDGSMDAPFRSIQPALDLVGSRGGGLVAVAAGTYTENLELASEHAGVHLAGRCRELVILDASGGGVEVPGIAVGIGYSEAEIAGLTIRGGYDWGLEMSTGVVSLHDVDVIDSEAPGILAYRVGMAGTELTMERVRVLGRGEIGIAAMSSGTELSLRDCRIEGLLPGPQGFAWSALWAMDGAWLTAEDCSMLDNSTTGAWAQGEGTELDLDACYIDGTLPRDDGDYGYGLFATEGALLTVTDTEVVRSSQAGLYAFDPGTEVRLRRSVIRETQLDGDGIWGCATFVRDGARLEAESFEFSRNAMVGMQSGEEGCEVLLRDGVIEYTRTNEEGTGGYGAQVLLGARLSAESVEITHSHALGMNVSNDASHAVLRDVAIRTTMPDHVQDGAIGIQVHNGGSLQAWDSEVTGTEGGALLVKDAGGYASLHGCYLGDSLMADEWPNNWGVQANSGGTLELSGCELANLWGAGIAADHQDTTVYLEDSAIRGTGSLPPGLHGVGLQIREGARVVMKNCTVMENSACGLVMGGIGTVVEAEGSRFETSRTTSSIKSMAAGGVCVQTGAFFAGKDLVLRDNEGPGLFVSSESAFARCSDCLLEGNQFSGAVVYDGGILVISDSTLVGNSESTNVGGGVGVFAATQWEMVAPTLILERNIIGDHPVAGVWLRLDGSHQLTDNTITSSTGLPHGVTTRCGDGVYAVGVGAWDGTQGLLLEGNSISGNAGAGLFLDDAAAVLSDNSWAKNDPDLFVQGELCQAPEDGYDEAPEAQLCPAFDRPACELEFAWDLELADLEARLPPPPGSAPVAGDLWAELPPVREPGGARWLPASTYPPRSSGR